MARLIGTAGHVDHGKTSLIRALTGIDADRLPEEKARGLTIDVGFAYLDLPGLGRVSIVDVPGHERFVTNMLVGALGMDVVLLCVAADESVMPQTVEHFQIVELLPVERMVVALTRCDLADASVRAIAREEVAELLAPSRFAGSPVVETSASTGAGLDKLKRSLTDALRGDAQVAAGGWYLPIDRVFTVKGHGVVVTGTLSQGTVREGDSAVVLPEGIEARVRSIESHDVAVQSSQRGSRTALNLNGPKAEQLRRGQMLASPGVAFSTQVLDGEVRWLKAPKHGARVRVSIGAEEAMAKAFLNDHDAALVQLRFETRVAAAKGQPFIVRKYSPPTLLGGGRVVVPVAKERKKSERPEAAPQGASDEETVVAAVGRTEHGLENDELCRLLGRSPQALGDVLEGLKQGGSLLGFAGLWMTPEQYARDTDAYLAALSAVHESEPTKLSHAKDAPLKRAGLPWAGKPLDRIVARMVEEGKLRAQGAGVAVATFRVKFSDRQRAMLDRVLAELGKNGLSAPSLEEVTRELKVPPQAVEETVRQGLAAGEVVRLADGYFLPLESVQQAINKTRQQFQGRQFTASEFREAFGTTRKYAIPFLEHLDSKGVTKRLGDSRVVV